MNRRDLLLRSSVLGLAAALPARWRFDSDSPPPSKTDGAGAPPLKPPATGSIPVAFLISKGAVVIDFCGPWEVFQDTEVPGRQDSPFRLYTVAEESSPIQASGGLKIVPDYSFATAPLPKVLVIPAQSGRSEKTLEWIRKVTATSDLTMSVCTGAFVLAGTGLLSGKSATTHHSALRGLAVEFPDVKVKPGARFIEEGNLATAGGLSSGIDLALRVVERYFGRAVAEQTAFQMEYQGTGWLNPDSNQAYVRSGPSKTPLCPVCEMEVDPKTAPSSLYKGTAYYFCSKDHKEIFDGKPDKYLAAIAAKK
jgi:putative intracellular protease/amidase/YHS domain-containing protein